jgi:hypothetical protein
VEGWQQPQFSCPGDSLAATIHTQLAIDLPIVPFDRVQAYNQGIGDLTVGVIRREVRQDLLLASCEGLDEWLHREKLRLAHAHPPPKREYRSKL